MFHLMLLTVCLLSVSFSSALLFTAVQAASTLLTDISEHTKAAGVRKITGSIVLPMQTISLICLFIICNDNDH